MSCWIISVTLKMEAAPSSSPTTMLAAAGTTNRLMLANLACRTRAVDSGDGHDSMGGWPHACLDTHLAALAAPPVLLWHVPATANRAAPASSSPAAASPSGGAAPLAGAGAAARRPGTPVCGDPTAMPTRDKLAQLLMVGVRNAADARAVVENHHVGGIMIGSWTDLSMLTDGSLPDIASAGSLPLAVSVDEEGGRVSRLSSLIGATLGSGSWLQTKTPDEVHQLALDRGVRCAVSASPSTSRRWSMFQSGRRHGDRRSILLQRPRGGHHPCGRLRARAARRRAAAGAEAFPGHGHDPVTCTPPAS